MQAAFNVESSLLGKLGEPGYYTLFAPTNEAFDKMDRAVMERVLEDKKVLQGIGFLVDYNNTSKITEIVGTVNIERSLSLHCCWFHHC